VLNGASTEAVSTIMEAILTLICGVLIAFYSCWQVALVALFLIPFMVAGGAMSANMKKAQEAPNTNGNN